MIAVAMGASFCACGSFRLGYLALMTIASQSHLKLMFRRGTVEPSEDVEASMRAK